MLDLSGSPVERVYGAVRPLGEGRSFLNLGWWADGATAPDEAAPALVRLVGRTAGLGPGQRVLDVGFGTGEQTLLWAREFDVAEVVGLDAVARHVEEGRTRVHGAGLAGRIRLERGSATATGLPSAGFHRIVAVESALHFDTRCRFFREAYRLLANGGVLVLADIVARGSRTADPARGLSDLVAGAVWAIPLANFVTPDRYRAQLRDAGFDDVEVRSIRAQVMEPMSRWLAAHLARPEVRRRLGPLQHAVWSSVAREGAVDAYDYVLARAVKPELPFPPGPAEASRAVPRNGKEAGP